MPGSVEKPTSSPTFDLTSLSDQQLATEKTRAEVQSLQIEIQELRAWRTKLIFSSAVAVVAPLGSVLLFLVGWYGSHASERLHQEDEQYTRAATQLASPDASVRLSSVITLQHFVRPAEKTVLTWISESLFASKPAADQSSHRKAEAMALLIGSLTRENDPAVLNAIADDAAENPATSLVPLIAINKTATVVFARAAGRYSGISALHMKRKASFEIDYWKNVTENGGKDPTVTDLANILLRTGSPFEVTAMVNQRFSSRDFLSTRKCGFHELFEHQQILTTGEGINDTTRTDPPASWEVDAALENVIDAALTLERSSYILVQVANRHPDALGKADLFGTAIVVGELRDDLIGLVRERGAYYSSTFESTPNPGCHIPSRKQ